MMIRQMHFVQLPVDNDICSEDRSFVRISGDEWYETNGLPGDRYDEVKDEITLLKLELFFWKNINNEKIYYAD